ncbi:MAG TPA: T9SS type A sorting domain-containing protein, partial [Flavisolibacter sp.]
YGYKQVFVQKLGGFGQSGSCNINVLCPQGTGWENERNSVAVVALQNGSALCSGAMLNNTCNSNTPYFLTANHCFTANGGQNVGNWRFYFQAWSSTCSPSQNSNGLLFNGSTLRANWAPTDFALVQLNQAPAPNSGINYAGWSRSTTAATSGVGIHHPSGDVMKISTYTTPVVRADNFTWNINGQTLNPVGDLQWIVSWNNGVTEGGSSGSPLFDQNHRVIGQLGGGPSGCGNAVQQDAYGRFDNSWTGGGTNATRLSNWLDPIGSNALTANTVNVSALASSSTPINGDGEICSGSKTYTVNTGVVTGWSISPSSGIATIQGNGNSATVTATGTGSVTISATLCGVADPIYKNISVGAAPVYPTFISYGYWNSYPNPATNLYASVCRSSSYPYNQPIQLAYPIGVQNLVAYPYSGSGYPTVYQNTITWDSYSGTLRVEYDVACGHVVQFLHFTNTCGYGSYTVYPNPGGDDVILSEQVAAKEADPGKAKAKTIEVQVTDHLGQARIRKTFARSNNYKLNVRQLPEGVYFIRITDGENVYNEKLVIRR